MGIYYYLGRIYACVYIMDKIKFLHQEAHFGTTHKRHNYAKFNYRV